MFCFGSVRSWPIRVVVVPGHCATLNMLLLLFSALHSQSMGNFCSVFPDQLNMCVSKPATAEVAAAVAADTALDKRHIWFLCF